VLSAENLHNEGVSEYKNQMKEAQKKHLIELMNSDEELGLYDT
jgi:hypothetical protein